MTRVGLITWTPKGFTVSAAAPASSRPPAPTPRRPAPPRRRPSHTTLQQKELSRR